MELSSKPESKKAHLDQDEMTIVTLMRNNGLRRSHRVAAGTAKAKIKAQTVQQVYGDDADEDDDVLVLETKRSLRSEDFHLMKLLGKGGFGKVISI